MSSKKLANIREQLREMVLNGIALYLEDVDVSEYVDQANIEIAIESRMTDYITNLAEEILEEVVDEVFDNL